MPSSWSSVILFTYGIVLVVLGVIVAGGGHGSYLLIWLAGAPFSIFGIPIAIVAAILQWGLLAFALQRFTIRFKAVLGFLILHYVVAASFVFRVFGQIDDLDYIRRSPHGIRMMLVLGLGCYIMGQCFVWYVSLHKNTRN
jgi:hypothetical protein